MSRILTRGDLIADRYRVETFIGQGGMQEVYRAVDTSLGRHVALKVPKNDSGKKRFARSAAMSARVTHPNVAKTYDYVDDGRRQFLVEEFIDGHDLRHMLEEVFYCLDPHLAAHVLHHLAKGLEAVHREKVIHRDLKPSNIMLSGDEDLASLKITDFGIAKMAEAEIGEGVKSFQDETLASRTVVGAIPYMAPEVLSNRDDVSTSADVWSLGAIAFYLLTGEKPFGDGVQAVQKILARKPPDRPAMLAKVTSQFRQLVDELWDLMMQCLAADPNERPTASELVAKCNRLCYSRAPRVRGCVESYRPKKGKYGFITSDAHGDHTFFHADSFWGHTSPEPNQHVCFARFPGTPRARAHPVLLMRNAGTI